MKNSDKIASKIIRGIVSGEEIGWPPSCLGVFYQPERPACAREAHKDDKKEKDTKTKA